MDSDFAKALNQFRALSESAGHLSHGKMPGLPSFRRHGLERQDLFSRIGRRMWEKVSPPMRDLFRARRERQQRHRRHSRAGVMMRPRDIITSPVRSR